MKLPNVYNVALVPGSPGMGPLAPSIPSSNAQDPLLFPSKLVHKKVSDYSFNNLHVLLERSKPEAKQMKCQQSSFRNQQASSSFCVLGSGL